MKILYVKNLKNLLIFLLFFISLNPYYSQLKSIVYDFDGLNLNQTDLPEGDYSSMDLSYAVAANPLAASDMIGDRVLKLNLNWSTDYGVFGRGISRYIEFDPLTDKFNFYFYNPISNNQTATIDVVLTEDDNQNNTFENTADDAWKKNFVIAGSSGWQLFSVPLSSFTDFNTGGNGIFDAAFTQNKGMLLMVEFRFYKSASGVSNPSFYLDMINFTEGDLPTGATTLDLPPKSPSDYCRLGGFHNNMRGFEQAIPSQVEGLFPAEPGKKLKYVTYFLDFAYDGTNVAKELPGNEVQTLINNGYTPIITWEPMFKGMDKFDARQPNLSKIINGDFNSYIDQFADKVKTYTDTVSIRLMHEFQGDWYPWAISKNGGDASLFVSAYRKIVDRFRSKGANNVKWIWCVNSDYFPYTAYNWILNAYPGNNYVDVIATDVYNNIYPTDLPLWKSFKSQMAESYYYLTKYFPQKPLYLCEFGCRERKSTDDPTSESKADWFSKMDKELQSTFHKTRALVFFDAAPDQNWYINSSPSSLQSLNSNIWYDDYYFPPNLLSIILTSPVNNTVLTSGSSLTLSAKASGSFTPLQKIEFYSGSTKLGEDVTSPYTLVMSNISSGAYALTAKVIDHNGNTAVSNTVNVLVESLCNGNGSITREVWNAVSGTSVSLIPLNTTPSYSTVLTSFQAPENIGDNYGQRIRGYVCPPATGNYTFWITGDDNTELWLSTNELATTKQKIAFVNGWTMSNEWTKYPSQQSNGIYLTAGQKYYIEALHKEGSQGDNLSVGWQLPNGSQERPIPGLRLSPFGAPLIANITYPSINSVFNTGSTILIQGQISGGTGSCQKMEFFDGATKLGESTTNTYSWTTAQAGTHQITIKVTDTGNATATSSVITISVGGNCTATGFISREVWNNVTGFNVTDIPLTSPPTLTGSLTTFEAPQNTADNYGQRISGYICPPASGNYTFWIASDDNSELWLSANNLAVDKQKIASLSGYASSRQWTKYSSQQSAPVNLIAGQKYYIEALHKEGSQGDNLAVGWQLPDGSLERPIPGIRLSEYTVAAQTSSDLITAGSNWKYLDNGSYPGATWNTTSFSDAGWASGNSELGYGDGGEATFVGYGSSSTNKYITTYFRKTINVADISLFSGLELSLIRDDGAVVYINGTEVFRNNMPSGPITNTTLAASTIDGIAESSFIVTSLSSSFLVNGNNFIAVEIHQQNPGSSDISFNLKLKPTASVFRDFEIKPKCQANIQASGPTTFCDAGKVLLQTPRVKGFAYQWIKDETEIPGAITTTLMADEGGDYQVKITSVGCIAWSPPTKLTIQNEITARITNGGPLQICEGDHVTLYANTCSDYNYQWKKDDINIPGATESTYLATTSGNYQVKIIQGASIAWSALAQVIVNKCKNQDTTLKSNTDSLLHPVKALHEALRVNVYPNPSTGLFSFDFCLEDAEDGSIEVRVINATGQFVYIKPIERKGKCVKETIELNNELPIGIYVLQIRIGNKVENTKLLLNR